MKKLTAVAVLTCVVALLAGCATDSPDQHGERLRKAAGLKVFHIETTPTLWEETAKSDTRNGPRRPAIKAETTDLDNGLVLYEVDGVTMANFLRQLDYDAHGGWDNANFSRSRKAESQRMYDEIAAVIDEVNERPEPGSDPPKITVDDAFAPLKG